MSKEMKYLVLENYIGGKFVPCSKLVDSFDPSTGEIYCKVPDSGSEEVRFFLVFLSFSQVLLNILRCHLYMFNYALRYKIKVQFYL